MAHLGDALKSRRLGMGHHVGMFGREKIARREPRIVVRGTDQAVEIEFLSVHVNHGLGTAPRVNPRDCPECRSAAAPGCQDHCEIGTTDDTITVEVCTGVVRTPHGQHSGEIAPRDKAISIEIADATTTVG